MTDLKTLEERLDDPEFAPRLIGFLNRNRIAIEKAQNNGDDPRLLSLIVPAREFDLLGYLIEHYMALVANENARRAQLAEARKKSGRKPVENPAASTVRARASRARKKAAKEDREGDPEKSQDAK